ncbi:hypothetical protein [Nocardia heshunensis]
MARGTTRRFARAESPEELLVNNGTGYRAGILDDFKPYLHQRSNEGCTNAARLFEEITARGFRGQPNLVRTYLHPFRRTAHIPTPPPKPPAVRRVTAPAHLRFNECPGEVPCSTVALLHTAESRRCCNIRTD